MLAPTYGLRGVHHGDAGDGRELAEELQREVTGGGRGEALEQQLLQAGEAAPAELRLQLLQPLAVLGAVEGHARQQLVHQPQRHLILELEVRLHERDGHPEDGGEQRGRVPGVARVEDRQGAGGGGGGGAAAAAGRPALDHAGLGARLDAVQGGRTRRVVGRGAGAGGLPPATSSAAVLSAKLLGHGVAALVAAAFRCAVGAVRQVQLASALPVRVQLPAHQEVRR